MCFFSRFFPENYQITPDLYILLSKNFYKMLILLSKFLYLQRE